MTDEALAARIRRLEDREAIRTLITRYSLAVDNHDWASLGSLWAPDARYGWVGEVQAEGAEAIGALLQSRIGPSGPSYHVNHDHLIEQDEADPDHASGIVCAHAEVCPGGRHQLSAIRYNDKYVRHEGRWLFAERFLGFLYFTPVETYDGVLLDKDRLRLASGNRPAHWPAFG